MSEYPEYSDRITERFVNDIFHASPLHDIGKVAIPDAILLKPGALTAEEFTIMKTHTTLGAETLEDVLKKHPANGFIRMGIEISLSHHEKWNGSGYPRGLGERPSRFRPASWQWRTPMTPCDWSGPTRKPSRTKRAATSSSRTAALTSTPGWSLPFAASRNHAGGCSSDSSSAFKIRLHKLRKFYYPSTA